MQSTTKAQQLRKDSADSYLDKEKCADISIMKYSNLSQPSPELYPRTDGKRKQKKLRPRAIAAKKQRTAEKLIRVLAVTITALLIIACIVGIILILNNRAQDTQYSTYGLDSERTVISDTDQEIKATEASTAIFVEETSVVLASTPDRGMAYQNSLCFLGDSLTAHLISREVLENGRATTQVLATRAGMLNLNSEITCAKVILPESGEAMTVAEAVAKKRPPILVITLGTDWGVSYLNADEFKYCYSKLIKEIGKASPDTDIILQSIFPVSIDCKVLDNKKIDRANEWVKELCQDHGLKYLNTAEILKDADGNLRRELCDSFDGIHLTRGAYIEILGYIRTHAWEK